MKRKIIIFIIVCLICTVALIFLNNYRIKLENKKKYIAEPPHTTANDDRKLIKYDNFEIFQNYTETKLKATQIFNDFNKFVEKDIQRVKNADNFEKFFEEYSLKSKESECLIEHESLENLYEKIKNRKEDFSKDYNSCKFTEETDNLISFSISYETGYTISGYIFFDESNAVYIII